MRRGWTVEERTDGRMNSKMTGTNEGRKEREKDERIDWWKENRMERGKD